MALKTNKLAAATAVAAAFSMLATPVQARSHRWHHRDRVDAGDVIGGVLVLGAIAAIASAASNRYRADRYPGRYPDPRDGDARYQAPRGDDRFESRGMDRAVDMCVGEVEQRSARVDTVDNASRDADGWAISGALENGASYSCRIGNDGRISDVRVGGREAGYDAPADNGSDDQWSDEDYARARTAQNDVPPPLPPEDDGRYDTSDAPDFDQ
jgi:hypothetical protein